MRKLIVSEKYNNKKVKEFVLENFKDLSENNIYKAFRRRDIRINGEKISKNTFIHKGDEIMVFIPDECLHRNRFKLKTIYEDENILCLYKPKDMPTISEMEDAFGLYELAKAQFKGYLEPVHRLDRNTDGLVIFAKNEQSKNILLEKFKDREIEKHYVATVYGIPEIEHRILKDYLVKDSKNRLVKIYKKRVKDSVEIITEYTVIDKNITDNTATIDILLHTGKTHQIRAHLAYYNMPIIGDGKYGLKEINKKYKKKYQMLTANKIIFRFKDNNMLSYLNDVVISL